SRLAPDKLHRLADNQNDWDGIPDESLTRLQRLGKRTNGIVTMGNAITTAGATAFTIAMFDLLNGNKIQGLVGLGISRGADLADGAAADATQTKSKFGRDFDPSIDAAELMIGAPVLTHVGALPVATTVAMTLPKAIDIAASVGARWRNIEVNPTEEGKLGAGAIW